MSFYQLLSLLGVDCRNFDLDVSESDPTDPTDPQYKVATSRLVQKTWGR